jgi:hypothetical protein
MGSGKRTSPTGSDAAAVATAVVDAAPAATAAVEVPDPKTDYTSLDDAKLDGNKAFGKTALLHVWRGSTEAAKVTLYQCRSKGMNYVNATYTDAQKPLVKAIPPTIPMHDTCPRVVLKITGKEQYGDALKADIVQILDAEPAEVKPLPAGVDYVSMDDVNMDGTKAAGKVARIRVYRGSEESTKFTAFGCGRTGGTSFLNVKFTTEQKEDVKTLPSTPVGCLPIKVKLLTQDFAHTWNAQLLEVSKTDD